jgi:two-component system, NarL family, nitrate/nitrite response regulator NarL
VGHRLPERLSRLRREPGQQRYGAATASRRRGPSRCFERTPGGNENIIVSPQGVGEPSLIRVVIVGEVALHCEGLLLILGSDARFTVCGVVSLDADTPSRIHRMLPDVIILDVEAAPAAVPALGAAARELAVVAIATRESDDQIIRCAAVGIRAVFGPAISTSEFASTLASIARREVPCCPRIASALMRNVGSFAARLHPRSPGDALTPRESEIVGLVVRGLSNKEIGALLHIQVATVKTHVHHVLEKLQLSRRGEIAAWARSEGFEGRGSLLVARAAGGTTDVVLSGSIQAPSNGRPAALAPGMEDRPAERP